MARSITTSKFPGMNNVDRVAPVKIVHNMVVTPDAKLERRDGYYLWLPLFGAHSLFFDGEVFFLAAAGTNSPESLYRVTLNREVTEICSISGVGDRLWYVPAAGRMYVSSRSWNGVYEDGEVRPWGTSFTDDPAVLANADSSEQHLLLNTIPAPRMENLCHLGGRIMGSVGSRLYYSDPPFAYELFRPDTFHDFSSGITMIVAAEKAGLYGKEGIFIAGDDATWFAGGYDPEQWEFARVGDGAIPGTCQVLPHYKEFNNVPVWLTRTGVQAGINGTVQPLTSEKVRFDVTGSAASFYREEKGGQYLSSFAQPHDVGFGDQVTCEVVRGGTLTPPTVVPPPVVVVDPPAPPVVVYRSYYVDSAFGDDNNPGTFALPWKTVSRVNRQPLVPGDTVGFKAGSTWATEYLQVQSGEAGKPVVYTTYGEGAKPILKGFMAIERHHAKAEGLDLRSNDDLVVIMASSYITVDGCDITSTASGWSPAVSIQKNSHHNALLNCNVAARTAAMNDAINLRYNADYNLIMGNTVTIEGIHSALNFEGATSSPDAKGTANYNIVKGNTFIGRGNAGALFNICSNSNYGLYEGNVLMGISPMAQGLENVYAAHQTVFKLVTHNNIVRGNILKNYEPSESLGLAMEVYTADNGFVNNAYSNYVYGNVITNIQVGGAALYLGDNGLGTAKCYGNHFKNNAVFGNGGKFFMTELYGNWPEDSVWQQMKIKASSRVYGNYFDRNLFYTPQATGIMWMGDDYKTVAQVEDGTYFKGNMQQDPMLDPATLLPLDGSPCIGAGAHLTAITSAPGTGTEFTVDDAGYFCDGHGLIDADLIQVGAQQARVTAVDKASNRITVESPVTWTVGMSVSLPYTGVAPNVGI